MYKGLICQIYGFKDSSFEEFGKHMFLSFEARTHALKKLFHISWICVFPFISILAFGQGKAWTS